MDISATAGELTRPQEKHLYGPLIDFLVMGGAYLLILPILAFLPVDAAIPAMTFWALIAANFVNHPHFAYSYQIFYRDYRDKISGIYAPSLKWRYIFAGIVVPILLIGYLALAVAITSPRLLGYAGNLYVFFVGWHYVKQGYGMLMLDAALKRRFLKDIEKNALLINCYVVWITSFAFASNAIAEKTLWGISSYAIKLPATVLYVLLAVAVLTTAAAFLALFRAWKRHGALPWNGLVGYAVSLYAWLAFIRVNPLFPIVVPLFHSIQYMAVVWRYQLNAERDAPRQPGNQLPGFPLFLMAGLGLGAAGFWIAPMALDQQFGQLSGPLGGSAFLFAFWVAINVHHYFIDNVIWRRDNPAARKYLFA
jgi:hypothetical protein